MYLGLLGLVDAAAEPPANCTHRSTHCRRRSDPRSGICSVVCADTESAMA